MIRIKTTALRANTADVIEDKKELVKRCDGTCCERVRAAMEIGGMMVGRYGRPAEVRLGCVMVWLAIS